MLTIDNVFKNTCYFPPPRTDVTCMSGYDACLMSGLPMFASDVGKDGKKKYMTCGYEYFCGTYYRGLSNRHMYEVLRHDKPTKIYIDMDCSDMTKGDAFEDEKDRVIVSVREKLCKEVACYVLEGSTSKKYSYHIIFEYYYGSIEEVKFFMMDLCERNGFDYVDRNVYTKNRLFRLLYSSKITKGTDSRLREVPCVTDGYSEESLFRSLIQGYIPGNYNSTRYVEYADLCRFVDTYKCDIPRNVTGTSVGTSGISIFGSMSLFHNFVDRHGGVLLSCKENDAFVMCIVGGKKCGHEQRHHKSNNQYFTITKSNMMGYWRCADADCKKSVYGLVDMRYFFYKLKEN